ncbi:MAG: cytochrome c3 family protein [Acidobacteria bacterium]|nr:cytochrome c3 family protein [Acidobacteriota bacterium]
MLVRKIMLLVFVLTLGVYGYGQFVGDGGKQTVLGTDHDLRGEFSGATAVCDFCHVPHKFNSLTNQPPLLWNVQVKPGPYSVYSSASLNGVARDPSTATSATGAAFMSLLCLSCHDGTITQASFYQTTSGMGGAGSTTPPNVGGTSGLSNDHPVDFTYSAALASADGGLRTPTEGAAVRIPYVGTGNLPLYKDQSTDTSGRMECATCHNPHNDTNQKFMRMANSGSALCLNCHGL